MKVGDLVRWKNVDNADDWIGMVVAFENLSFVHVLWAGQSDPWTWIVITNLEKVNESR